MTRALRCPVLIVLTLFMAACGRPAVLPAPEKAPPDLVLGEFQDDYGSRFTVTPVEWFQRPGNRFHVLRWNPASQYLIAKNDSSNRGEGGRYTRIDWMPLPGMPPYEWGFCLTAYDAPTAAAAEATAPPRREVPKIGCNGFPFSRMRRVAASPGK